MSLTLDQIVEQQLTNKEANAEELTGIVTQLSESEKFCVMTANTLAPLDLVVSPLALVAILPPLTTCLQVILAVAYLCGKEAAKAEVQAQAEIDALEKLNALPTE